MTSEQIELLSEQKPKIPLVGRRVFLQRLFGTSSALLLAACTPQPKPQPQTAPIEARPVSVAVVNPPKVESLIQRDNDTPEKRFKNWFNAVVSGNKEEYLKQSPVLDKNSIYPLQTGLTDLYKACDINKVKIIDSKERSNDIWDYVFDFQSNCIPGDRKAPNGRRYVEVREIKDNQGI